MVLDPPTPFTTLQAIFDHVARVLSDRGWTRALDPQTGLCRYRSPVGPCAIGACIPDTLYDPGLESLGSIESGCEDQSPLLSDIVDKVFAFDDRDEMIVVLNYLQIDHDQGHTPDLMRRYFRKFAERYNLTLTAGVDWEGPLND